MDEIEYTMKQIQDWLPAARAAAAGDELRALRKSGGLTQLEAGRVLGVEQWEISKFERGLTPIPEGLRSDLAAYLTGGELKTGKTHISARIPADLRHHIEQFAKSEGVSFTAALKKIIKEHAGQGIATATHSELDLRVSAMEGSLDKIIGTLVDNNEATSKLTSLVSGLVDEMAQIRHAKSREGAAEPVTDFSAPPPPPRPVYTLPAIKPKERSPLDIIEAEESGEDVSVFEPAPPWRPSPWGWIKAGAARFLFRELRPFKPLDVAVFLRLAGLSTLRPFLADLVSRGRKDLAEGYRPAVISKHLAMLRDWVLTEPTITEESAAARYAARALGYIEEMDKAQKMTPEGLEELKADARSRDFGRGQRALDHYRGTVEYQIQRLKVIHAAGWKCSDCGVELTNTPNKPESAQWDHAHYHNPTEERQGVDAFAVCSACHTKREQARGRGRI